MARSLAVIRCFSVLWYQRVSWRLDRLGFHSLLTASSGVIWEPKRVHLSRTYCSANPFVIAEDRKYGNKQILRELREETSNMRGSQMQNVGGARKHQIGENVSRKDKIHFLVNTLLDLKDSKESVYGALDSWVAWEPKFPIASLKKALFALEKEHQWHRVVQVIKWMLSKGQGTTMGTYGQLVRALDMDHRAEEAHMFWEKKIGIDLHSVPWQLCNIMISIYYRNNMLPNLIKLFKGLEAFDRKPPEKSIVQKVADAYEMLGMLDEKERVLTKYEDLFIDTAKGSPRKSRIVSKRENK